MRWFLEEGEEGGGRRDGEVRAQGERSFFLWRLRVYNRIDLMKV